MIYCLCSRPEVQVSAEFGVVVYDVTNLFHSGPGISVRLGQILSDRIRTSVAFNELIVDWLERRLGSQ
jgi:hypothetical protein